MDQQAAALLATLKKPTASSEAKVNLLNALKSDIKHYRVPENAQASIFEVLKLAITQQTSSTLASTGVSTLGHLLKRLKIQDESGYAIKQFAPRLFPPLQERLGDLREPVRTAASQALSDIYTFLPNEVEEIIREGALEGTNTRAKETAMLWIVKMHRDDGMPFKAYVGPMVARLEDADGAVRDTARTVLIELFRDAPDRAKVDLKRQLKAYAVRLSIEAQILAQINVPTVTKAPLPARTETPDPDMEVSKRAQNSAEPSHVQTDGEVAKSAVSATENVPIEPLYLHSQRELEDMFRDMTPYFEGKETEHNWLLRDKSITKLRRLLAGNVVSEYLQTFMTGLKAISDGIIKVSTSLRTTMSVNGCLLVQELARTLGPAMDSLVELFLHTFIKMSAATKHIAMENGRLTSDAIFQNCSYHVRFMQHIWTAAQEKNATLRQCVPDWLLTILKRQAGYKHQFDASGGLALAEKCVKKGLDDANPKVKEKMRATYWTFAKHWPDKAEAIISKLDPKSRSALEKDPNNPNAALHGGFLSASTSSLRTGGTASRSNLREVMAEQRKAKIAGLSSSRPSSAMASLSPAKMRSEGNLKAASRQPSSLSHSSRSAAQTTSVAGTPASEAGTAAKRSALMSGPVRRPRRAEIARPQTADPYASKRLLRPETPLSNSSSRESPPKGTDRSKMSSSSTSTARSRIAAPSSGYGHQVASPSRRGHLMASPSGSQDSRPSSKHSTMTQEEDFTMIMPADHSVTSNLRKAGITPKHKHPGQTLSMDSGLPPSSEGDDFTLVLPDVAKKSGQRVSLAYQSPLKAMFEEAREILEKSRSPPRDLDPLLESGPVRETTIVRGESPPKSHTPQPDEVRIYEDPFTADASDVPVDAQRKVLGELPVNENIALPSPTRGLHDANRPGSPRRAMTEGSLHDSQSGHDRADVMRNRRLLASGIERIRTRELDAHGFRRVQDLAKSTLDIWDSGRRFDDLIGAVLDFLQTFESDVRLTSQPTSKTQGLKAQALSLVRALLTVHRKYAVAWHAKALTTILVCRRSVDSTNHLLTDLERTCDTVVAQAAPGVCVGAALDFLAGPTPSLSAESTSSWRSIAMALNLLRQCLGQGPPPSAEVKVRLTRTAARYLDAEDAPVRKADVELASELFELYGSSKTEFWAEFKGSDEGRLGLLTYYIARRAKAA